MLLDIHGQGAQAEAIYRGTSNGNRVKTIRGVKIDSLPPVVWVFTALTLISASPVKSDTDYAGNEFLHKTD